MVHTVIIETRNGEIINITASGDTKVLLIESNVLMADIDVDREKQFEFGIAWKKFTGYAKEALKSRGI